MQTCRTRPQPHPAPPHSSARDGRAGYERCLRPGPRPAPLSESAVRAPLPGSTDGAGRNLGRLLKPSVPSRGLQTTWTARDLEQRQTVRNPDRGQAHCSPGAQGQGADLDTTCILGESGDWPQLQKLDLWPQGLLGRGAQRGEPHRELNAAR